MPLYDVRCIECQTYEEVFCTIPERETQFCAACGSRMSVVIGGVRTVGPMPSKPLDMEKQLGVKFHSNQELRNYQAANPNVVFVDRGDTALKNRKDHAREQSETAARRAGFRDLDHRRADAKKGGGVRN